MEKAKLNKRENAQLSYERDYAVYGFSWPHQRNYKCTFCTKEFKSPQALGGHMNVHRRDRARLRQSPSSWVPPNPNPNPNPNFSISSPTSSSSSTSSTAVRFLPYPPNIYHHSFIPTKDENRVPLIAHSGRDFVGPQIGDIRKKLSISMGMGMGMGMESNVGELKGFVQENGVWKKTKEIVRMGMELELGLVRDAKEGLDLELRLGQSN